MAETVLTKRLAGIYRRLIQEQDTKLFGKILSHEFMALVNDDSSLCLIWKAHLDFYANLAKDEEYLQFIDALHEKMERLQRYIDRETLTSVDNRWRNFFKGSANEKDSIALPDVYDLLSGREMWWTLGNAEMPFEVGDACETCWKPVLGQYQLVDTLIRQAEYQRCIVQTQEAYDFVDDIQRDIKKLTQILEQPMQRLHIDEFETVDHYARNPEWITDAKAMNALKRDMEIVYSDVSLELEESATTPAPNGSRGKKAVVRYKGNGVIQYKGTDYKMVKDSLYANLSDKIYEHCQQVGRLVAPEVLFQSLGKGSYQSNEIVNQKWLYHTVRTANRWAERKKLPELFSCTNEGVKRLI